MHQCNERSFSTGSVDAPDPFDKHLDKIGYYRKHTARDASCLFRVISEQMYNAQIHHADVRDICVNYMNANRSTYEELVGDETSFDDYLTKMSKQRTFGTLIELHALAYRFKRNVLLFEAFNSGKWYVHEEEFTEDFLVFFTPVKHFDSVFSKAFIESVAFCQSLTYEIVYSRVFKLPDVVYAVERMLHDPEEGSHVTEIEVSTYDGSHERLTLSDGRCFNLDHAGETKCILENYLLCSFHNKHFDELYLQLTEDLFTYQDDPVMIVKLQQMFDAMLPRNLVSCVRQLLDENIAPFPYKVAKALDNHIYRNTEFDVWNEQRKINRTKSYPQHDGIEIGVKCQVNLYRDQKSPYCCHIQEVNDSEKRCVVFIENLGDYCSVPFNWIKLYPSPKWVGHSYGRKKKRGFNEASDLDCVTLESFKKTKRSSKISECDEDCFKNIDIDYLLKPIHIPQQYAAYIATPMTKAERVDGGSANQPNKPNLSKKSIVDAKLAKKSDAAKNAFESAGHFGSQNNIPRSLGESSGTVPTTQYNSSNAPANMGHMVMDNSRIPQQFAFNCNVAPPLLQTYPILPISAVVKRKLFLQSMYPVNFDAESSNHLNGIDLPYEDVATLRFFYNLGQEYFRYLRTHYTVDQIMANLHENELDPHTFGHRSQRTFSQYDSAQEAFDMNQLSTEFMRCNVNSNKDYYGNKAHESGSHYRRPYGVNPNHSAKKEPRNYRIQTNKNKKYSDSSSSKYQSNHNKNTVTPEVPPTTPNTEANSRTSSSTEGSTIVHHQYAQMPPAHMLPYQTVDADQANVYGFPYAYGMCTNATDNCISTYPMQMQGAIMVADGVNENELAQTYPYYAGPNGPTYYYNQPQPIPQFPPMAVPPQGCWYAPPLMVPMTMPANVNMPTTSAMPPSMAAMPAAVSSSYGQFVYQPPNEVNATNNTNNNAANAPPMPFTPTEP